MEILTYFLPKKANRTLWMSDNSRYHDSAPYRRHHILRETLYATKSELHLPVLD